MPCSKNNRQRVLFLLARAMNTVPTGLVVVAPPGPAIPVILSPKSADAFFRMFCAINIATCRETAPYLVIVFAGMFRIMALDLLL